MSLGAFVWRASSIKLQRRESCTMLLLKVQCIWAQHQIHISMELLQNSNSVTVIVMITGKCSLNLAKV